jgi:histidine triad (HIT) family protein
MEDCIFCKIITGEIAASKVFEDDRVLAFMDLHPINEGHVLVIPKKHSSKFSMVDESDAGRMFQVAQKILKSIEDSPITCEGANLYLSDGSIAGQDVFHSHLHITPRFSGDGYRMGFSGSTASQASRENLDRIAKLLRDTLRL